MKRIFSKRNMTEVDWQEYRANQVGIGGSEVATVLDINPWKARFNLWLEKTGQEPREKVDNEYITWGNLLEPIIRTQFAKETGYKVQKNNFVMCHDDYDWMIANIDGEVKVPEREGKGVLEIKTTSEWNGKEWNGENIPVHYMAQMQHYLAVTGYEYGIMVVLIGGNKLRHWFVERNDEVIEQLIAEEKKFMKAVETGEYPWIIGGSSSESQYLANKYPVAFDVEESMPQPLESLGLEYNELQEQIKAMKERTEIIKNQFRFEAKEIQKLRGNSIIVSMPTVNKVLFDSKKFQKDHPDLYAEYKTKESSYRDFKIKLLEVN